MNAMAYSEPDPLSGNWSYDSAIDLFALNPVFPDPFQMDLADELLPMDPKEFAERPVQQPITGYTMSHHPGNEVASLPSDVESDDQSWSPTHLSSLDNFAMDMLNFDNVSPSSPTHRRQSYPPAAKPARRSRWPSSEPHDDESVPTPAEIDSAAPRKPLKRTLSEDSASSGAGPTSATTGRNAAKRAAHNIIEKRYRTNMNAKFVALEKAMDGAVGTSMSATASAAPRPTRGGSSASLKKSEILSNAIAYMQELQEANQALRKEMTLLRQSMGLGRRY
ncbi:hypothetical protein BDW42DRAFT_172946 [Aspergillus taichungensis]|uniref:BHLH domain-containing protein n=1 Tax=Aspergillus taichungensis TaxID=482145 RepID=A0A2J5HQ45_9EURO|nr:hypothetical protein BDW42DRAFT_172946 [Aspergillus taichungensis]